MRSPVLLAAILALGACATVEQPPSPPPASAPDPQILALTKQIEQLRATIAAVDLRPTYQLAEPTQE